MKKPFSTLVTAAIQRINGIDIKHRYTPGFSGGDLIIGNLFAIRPIEPNVNFCCPGHNNEYQRDDEYTAISIIIKTSLQ